MVLIIIIVFVVLGDYPFGISFGQAKSYNVDLVFLIGEVQIRGGSSVSVVRFFFLCSFNI